MFFVIALLSIGSFVQCMETKPGSFEDAAKAVKILGETQTNGGYYTTQYASMMNNLDKAIKNLTLATEPKTSQEQSTLQKLQSEVTSIKQTQSEISEKLSKLQQNVAFTNSVIINLVKNPEDAATIGNAIQMWMNTYWSQNTAQPIQTSEKETFANRRRVEEPLRSDIEPVNYSEVPLHYDDSETVSKRVV